MTRRIELDSPAGRLQGSRHRLGLRVETPDVLVRIDPRQKGPGQCQTGLELDRSLQGIARPQVILGVDKLVVNRSGPDTLPRVQLLDGPVLDFPQSGRGDDAVKVTHRRDDLLADVVLHFEDVAVGQGAVEGLRPDLVTAGGVDDLRRDSQPISRLADPSLEEKAHVELAADRLWVGGLTFVPDCLVATGDQQRAVAGQTVDDVLGDAVGKELLVGIAARMSERQHGD